MIVVSYEHCTYSIILCGRRIFAVNRCLYSTRYSNGKWKIINIIMKFNYWRLFWFIINLKFILYVHLIFIYKLHDGIRWVIFSLYTNLCLKSSNTLVSPHTARPKRTWRHSYIYHSHSTSDQILAIWVIISPETRHATNDTAARSIACKMDLM